MIAAFQLLADTDGWDHMSGWGWGWMSMMWLFWLSVIGIAIWAVTRRPGSERARSADAEQILAERFARGEIDVEEFEERRRALQR